MANTFFSWKTKKTETGDFEAIVTKVTSRSTPNATGHFADSETLQRVPCKTRARAKGHAIAWCRYYRAQAAA